MIEIRYEGKFRINDQKRKRMKILVPSVLPRLKYKIVSSGPENDSKLDYERDKPVALLQKQK